MSWPNIPAIRGEGRPGPIFQPSAERFYIPDLSLPVSRLPLRNSGDFRIVSFYFFLGGRDLFTQPFFEIKPADGYYAGIIPIIKLV